MSEERPRGFAGLSSRISDIEAEIAHAKSLPQAPPPQPEEATVAQPQSAARQREKKPLKFVWWGIGATALISVIWIGSQSGKRPAEYSPQASYAEDETPITVVGNRSAAQDVVPEEKPPLGYEQDLSVGQLKYCLAENIRLLAAEPAASNSAEAMDRYNALVSDFNGRCAEARYLDSTMSEARPDVEAHRAELEQAGRDLFKDIPPVVPPQAYPTVDDPFAGSNSGAVPETNPDSSSEVDDPFAGSNLGAVPETSPDASTTDSEDVPQRTGGI